VAQVIVDGDAVNKAIALGAQVSERVHNILVAEKVIEGAKKNVLPLKSKTVKRKELKK
jgi:ribosomal protein S16